ncbi:cysteine hydrolase family protein [Pseudomonas sp. DWP3-1-2]|uniref:cysteine hydrolase family protein n=1 Tax=Pseudomonas sp. DWP3-1-2 TaxID=2804645 RepID=UPI003CF2400C
MSFVVSLPQKRSRSLPDLLKAALAGFGVVAAQFSWAADLSPAPDLTIRAISGAMPVDHIDRKTTALLVIDFQNEYFTGRLPIPDGMKALENTQRLIRFADGANLPVIHVRHVAPKDSPVFAAGSEGVGFHPLMMPRAHDRTLSKTTVSVFASTDLDAELKRAGIKTVIVAGLMTHACVAGAARDAVPLGYSVVVASDATATRAITVKDTQSVSADELHRSALASIEDTFGDVMTTERITLLPVQ